MIELVAFEPSERVKVDKLPALVSSVGYAEQHLQETVPTKYNCLISWAEDHLVVWDLGGGMAVNGVQTSKASVGPGDTLRLGGVEFKVQRDEPKRYVRGLRC